MKYNLLIISGLLFTGCATKPYIVEHLAAATDSGNNQVHVVSHGWHTGFVVPAAPIQTKIPELKQRFDDIPYLEFGWGDKGFYQASEITSGLTMKAILWPTESVVHAVAVPRKADAFFANSEVRRLCLSDRAFASLITFIAGSFETDSNGQVLSMNSGIYGDSQFYKGVGNYYLMNTCNNWTAKGLKSAGMDISPVFKLTAGSIMDYLDKHERDLITNPTATDPLLSCQ